MHRREPAAACRQTSVPARSAIETAPINGWIGAKTLVAPLAPRSTSAILLQVGQPIAKKCRDAADSSRASFRRADRRFPARAVPTGTAVAGTGAKYVAMTRPMRGAETSHTATANGSSADSLGRRSGWG